MQMLKRVLSVIVSIGAAAAPVAAGAQERTRTPEKEERCECFRIQGVAPRAMAVAGMFGNRARLGVMIDSDADSDSIGARVEEVVDDSPAERAGLREGDIVTHVDGESLVRGGDRDDTPGGRLIELMADVEPGDTVRLDYRRGGEVRTATVVTSERSDQLLRLRSLERLAPHAMPGQPRTFRFEADRMHEAPGGVRVYRDHMLRFGQDLRLEAMNAGLEPYFGTSTGVLVLEVDEDTELKLLPGDVILRIGSRAVDDPGRAYQILETYRDGEDVTIEVMRNKQRVTVTGER